MRTCYAALAASLGLALAIPGEVTAQNDTASAEGGRIDIAPHAREASQRFDIPEHWIYAVIRAESAGRTRAVSPAGAMALMQLMPGTWVRQRARFALGNDPFDPRDNILAGTSYLREMYDLYGSEGFLAAYNAGPGRYADWLAGRRSLPRETRRYVARIAPYLHRERIPIADPLQSAAMPTALSPAPATSSAMPVRDLDDDAPSQPLAPLAQPAHDLFVPVSTIGER